MENTIKCSDCNIALMHYRIDQDSDKEVTIKASCPFCDGFSFNVNVKGEFSFGPIGKDENLVPTFVDDIEIDSNKVLFRIGRYK